MTTPITAKYAMIGDVAGDEIDAYLAKVSEPARSTLEALRATILEIVPDAEEGIAYGAPGFKLRGKTIAGFAAYKHHLSYLPHSGNVLDELADDVSGYETSKGALKFSTDQSLPEALVRKLLVARIAELETRPH